MFSRVMFAATALSLLVLVGGVWRLLDQPVRGFVIEGELSKLERAELQRVLAEHPVAGVLSTPLDAVADYVQVLPWARGVSVRRLWPDRLVVKMQIASPVARWGENQYLSAYGDLLSLPDSYPGLPEFNVALAGPEEAMQVFRLLDQIAAREQLKLSQLHQNAQGQWSVTLSKGPQVLLGGEQLNERMHRFLLLHRQVLATDTRSVEYVDARYGNGVAVKFADEQDLAEDPLLVAQNDSRALTEGEQ